MSIKLKDISNLTANEAYTYAKIETKVMNKYYADFLMSLATGNENYVYESHNKLKYIGEDITDFLMEAYSLCSKNSEVYNKINGLIDYVSETIRLSNKSYTIFGMN